MIQRYSYYVGQDMVEDNDEGPYVTYDDYTTDIAEKEAALNAEKQKVRELVECLSNVRALQEAIMNDRQSDLEFQHEQRCLARHAESLLRINTKALIAKYKGGTE